jgi:hypothetical protein
MFAVSMGMTVHGVFSSKDEASNLLQEIEPFEIFPNSFVHPQLFEIEEGDFVIDTDGRGFFRGREVPTFIKD